MTNARYKRILLKVSGEALCQPGALGVDADAIEALVAEIRPLAEMGVQIGLVVGGGNLIRGRALKDNPHIRSVTADQMGMAATLVNGLAVRDALELGGTPAKLLSAFAVPGLADRFSREAADRELDAGRVLVLAGGTGSPFFTTDTCAALRALEIDADVLFKATKVDGVFTADPVEHPDAEKYDELTYDKVIADRLGVMDLTAASMCMERELPIVVFQLSKPGNLQAAVRGEPVGTTIHA